MRLLADENVPRALVLGLRTRHDVEWILELASGSSDPAVLALAQAENRVLITFDKDFGELAFKSQLAAGSGIILVRVEAKSPDHLVSVVTTVLKKDRGWEGHFTVIDDGEVRMTPLPH